MDVQSSTRTSQPIASTLKAHPAERTCDIFSQSSRLSSCILEISLELPKDKNVYPLVHVYLVFLSSLLIVQQHCTSLERESTWRTIGKDMPWIKICNFLNALPAKPGAWTKNMWDEEFSTPSEEIGRPLPEYFILRGQLYTQWYFPAKWFPTIGDDDERSLDLPSTNPSRVERILWLGYRIACVCLTMVC